MTVGKVQGGEAFNVIPDSVTIGGTFRAFSKESLLQLKQRIEKVLSRFCIYIHTVLRAVFVSLVSAVII